MTQNHLLLRGHFWPWESICIIMLVELFSLRYLFMLYLYYVMYLYNDTQRLSKVWVCGRGASEFEDSLYSHLSVWEPQLFPLLSIWNSFMVAILFYKVLRTLIIMEIEMEFDWLPMMDESEKLKFWPKITLYKGVDIWRVWLLLYQWKRNSNNSYIYNSSTIIYYYTDMRIFRSYRRDEDVQLVELKVKYVMVLCIWWCGGGNNDKKKTWVQLEKLLRLDQFFTDQNYQNCFCSFPSPRTS